jgi:hypothetical protein
MRISTFVLLIIIGIAVLLVYMTPSVKLGLVFNNVSHQELFVNITDMKNHKVKVAKIKPKQDTYVEFISGEDSKEMRKNEFYIFIYDGNANVIFSQKFTGEEVVKRKRLKLDIDE